MTHAIRTRIVTFCLAILPAATVFSLLLLFPLSGLSQTPSFSTHTSFTLAGSNRLALHGDLNNDGYEDVIAIQGDAFSPSFSVYLSKGDGTYHPSITYPAANAYATPVALADFNNDGNLDLIAGAASDTYLYLGKGDGTFRAPITVGPYSGSEAVADVNHDGKMDILIASGSNLQVLFGNGDGTFHAGPVTPDVLSGSLLTGDFNGDGIIDVALVATSNAGTKLQVLRGDGKGNFIPTYSYTDNGGNIMELFAADVNGDGISDLIGTAKSPDQYNGYEPEDVLYVYYGQSNGGMVPAQIQLEGGFAWGYQFDGLDLGQVALADFNGDDIPDIAVGEVNCFDDDNCINQFWTIDVLSGEGNGEFAPDVPVSVQANPPSNLLALRGNRDTKADLVFGAQVGGNSPYPIHVITLLNTTTGNFPTCAAPNTAVGIAQCSPTTGSTVSSPVNFAIGAAADQPIRKVDIWVDRKKQFEQFAGSFFSNYAFLNASLPLAAGSHRVSVIAYGWDNSQVSKTSTIEVKASSSCAAPASTGVHICSPASGSSVGSPVLVTATSKVTGTIVSTQLWVDGVKNFNAPGSDTLTTTVSLAAGSHRFAVIATNTSGQKWESTVNATVK